MASRIQQNAVTGSGTSIGILWIQNTNAGTLLLCHCATSVAVNDVSDDSVAHNWTGAQAETVVNTNNRTRLYYQDPTTTEAGTLSISVNFLSSSVGIIQIAEYSGIVGAPLEQVNASSGFSATPSSGGITTTVNDTIIIGTIVIENTAGNPIDPTTGFTEINETTRGTNTPATGEWMEQFLAGTTTLNAAATLAGSTNWACQVAAFEAVPNPWIPQRPRRLNNIRPSAFSPGIAR